MLVSRVSKLYHTDVRGATTVAAISIAYVLMEAYSTMHVAMNNEVHGRVIK